MNIAVSISQASGSKFKANKHGQLPLILSAINGTLPENAGIIDYTVAERMGLKAGHQAVLNIQFRGFYEANGTKYPNYNYTLITILGGGFERMVAEKVVASMDFGFSFGTTPTPVIYEADEETPQVVEVPEVNAKLAK